MTRRSADTINRYEISRLELLSMGDGTKVQEQLRCSLVEHLHSSIHLLRYDNTIVPPTRMAANDYFAGSQNFPPHPQAQNGPPPPYSANYGQQQRPPQPSPQPGRLNGNHYPPPQSQAQPPWQKAYNSHQHPSKHYHQPHSSSHYPPPQVRLPSAYVLSLPSLRHNKLTSSVAATTTLPPKLSIPSEPPIRPTTPTATLQQSTTTIPTSTLKRPISSRFRL